MKPSEKPRNEKSADPIRENKMNAEKRKALEAAGWRLGDAADFLGLTQEERRLVELRLAVSRKVRELREKNGVTQQDLAGKLKSSQSRVAKIEAAAADVSLDLSIRALFAVGGNLTDLEASQTKRPVRKKRQLQRR
jgi:ribosome-binding protein aMBF1 (putative translation factor)